MTVWEKFTERQGNEHAAREAFDKLCAELLKKHFPGKKVISVNKLDKESDFKSLTVIFLPKFFTSDLTSSRKGQIRKGFNKAVEAAQAKNIKIFKWILCLPKKLSQTEQQWWAQWKYKNFDQYNIDIVLFDGEKIYNLAKQYGIAEQWQLETPTANNQVSTNEQIDILLQKQEKNEEKTIQETIAPEQKAEQPQNQQEPNTTEQPEEQKKETATNQQNVKREKENDDSANDTQENLFATFAEKFSQIKQKINELSGSAKEKFTELRQISDFEIHDFDLEELMDQTKDTELNIKYKARAYELDRQYDKALFLYQYLNNSKGNTNFDKALNKISKKLKFELNILNGDYYLASGNKISALEFYDKALKQNIESHEANLKYYETFGDLLMQEKLFKKAHDAYNKAMDFLITGNKIKDRLKKKQIAAQYSYWGETIPVLSCVFKFFAKKADTNTKVIPQDIPILSPTKTLYTFLAVAIIAGIIYFIPSNKAVAYKAADFETEAISKGDEFLEKFQKLGYLRIHTVDSARACYRRAMYYNPTNALNRKKYQKADSIWKNYIKIAQKRAQKKFPRYYTILSGPSEGAYFVKYKVNKSVTKYGYVDTNYRVIVPPVFDFDYNRRIKHGKENFNKGTAIVAIAIDLNDTAYFKINRKGYRVSKIIRIKNGIVQK